MIRYYRIPMQPPSSPDGRGRPGDCWRPKYIVGMAGVDSWSIVNERETCIATVDASEEAHAEISKQGDVEELTRATVDTEVVRVQTKQRAATKESMDAERDRILELWRAPR